MGCPSFYHEIGDCDVCMQMREREKKTKQIQIFDDQKKKKKIRNARIGKNSLLSLNVEKMLFFFLWKNKTSRTYCRETTLSMSKRSRILQHFFSTVVNQFDAVGEAFLRNPPKGTCQKSKSIKVFCYIRFGPMLKTFCNERKFGRF